MLAGGMENRSVCALAMMLGAGLLYASSRVALFALARADGADAGRRAIGQWIPIAAAALAAVLYHPASPDDKRKFAAIALAIIFGSSVACLSLVLGMCTYLAPLTALPGSRRSWPFI